MITTALVGLSRNNGTRYPGITKPDRDVPNLRLKNVTTKTPIQTVVITELLSAPVGNMGKGKIASNISNV